MIEIRSRRPAARRDPGGVPEAQHAVVLRASALLLNYPDEQLMADLPLLDAAAGTLVSAAAADPLHRLLAYLQATPLDELQITYTDTFDLRRRSCLYLTYFTHGDTRQRGMALLRFSHAYRSAGAEFTGDELPDHLAVVCEFAAMTDMRLGLRLLHEHRAGIELLRTALAEASSPYIDAVDAVRSILGPASQRDIDRALELARNGPPAEAVGLEPFGPPELMGGRR